MSGPKIDYAELERLKKEALEKARQERLRKIKVATKKLQDELLKNALIIKNIKEGHENKLKEFSDSKELELTLKRIRKLKEEFILKLTKETALETKTEPEEIEAQALALEKENLKLEAEYNRLLKKELIRIEEFIKARENKESFEAFSKALKEEGPALKIEDVTFTNIRETKKEDNASAVNGQEVLKEINALLNSPYLFRNDKELLLEFYENVTKALPCSQKAQKEAAEEFILAKNAIIRRIINFESLYLEYLAQYLAYEDILKSNGAQKPKGKPLAKEQFNRIEDIEREIENLRQLSCFEDEQQYIRAQIDEVMQLFGYSMCDSIVLGSAGNGQHYICNSISDDTAIHLHISQSNQLMMEVVAAKTHTAEEKMAAKALGSEQLTPIQRELLLEEQGRFCQIHPQITAALRERGVILTKKAHRLPSADYCKMIINYKTEEESKKAAVKRAKIKKQKEAVIK